MLLTILLFVAVLGLGVSTLRSSIALLVIELRRPQPRLVDTLYHRIDGCHYGYADVIELSNGRYELTWDVLDHCGMPDDSRRPTHAPL